MDDDDIDELSSDNKRVFHFINDNVTTTNSIKNKCNIKEGVSFR